MASKLLSRDEAEAILGVELETIEMDKEIPPGAIQCLYESQDYSLNFNILQDALRSETGLKYGSSAREVFHILVDFQKEESPEGASITLVEDLGDEAYFMDLAEADNWSLHILEGDYNMTISLFSYGNEDNNWIMGKLRESGQQMVTNLRSIIE